MPRVLLPDEVVALTSALRTDRDRAMISLMVQAGLRRCEVLGLRFGDVHIGDRRVFIADGKGGHQRLVPVVPVFFTQLADYLSAERPGDAVDDHVFVVLKGPTRSRPMSAAGLDQVLDGARTRAGLSHATCHELRHTCFTRLREAGMTLEAIQAQAGRRRSATLDDYMRGARMAELHLPMGGHRFRPGLEDVLQWLEAEFGVVTGGAWPEELIVARSQYRRGQTAAAVRDCPSEAVRALRDLGYVVTEPVGGPPEDRNARLAAF